MDKISLIDHSGGIGIALVAKAMGIDRAIYNDIYMKFLEALSGTFRVVCPDLDRAIKAYRDNDLDFFLGPYAGLTPSSREEVSRW